MSIFTTMRTGVSVLPPQTNRLPSMGEGGGSSDSFSSLVNGRAPAPEDNPPARLSIYNAISAEALDYLSNNLRNQSGDVSNDLPSSGDEADDEVAGKPGDEVTNALPLAGSVAGWSGDDLAADDLTSGLPEVDPIDDEVDSPIVEIGEGTVTNELPRVEV